MSVYNQYFPIVKAREAEFKSFADLSASAKAAITPVLEIPARDWNYDADEPNKSVDDHLKPIITKVEKYWGKEQPIFIDGFWLDEADRLDDGTHPMHYLLNELIARDVRAIPATGPDRDAEYDRAVKSIVDIHRDLVIRVERKDLGNLATILPALLQKFGIGAQEAHLLIDLGSIDSDDATTLSLALNTVLSSLPFSLQWKTVVLAGASFPKDLSDFARNSVNEVARVEWGLWMGLHKQAHLFQRFPFFGDYTISHPEPSDVDPRFMRMNAGIRYAANGRWIIIKGESLRGSAGFDQYRTLSANLIAHVMYAGPSASWGDQFITDCATGTTGVGNQTTWRRVGLTRHMTLIVEELFAL
jgi:hypothetical protein